MKKALALVLAIALTAAIAVGGTLAYLTDTDEDVNVMTIGKVKIDQLEFERIDTETADQNAAVQEFHDNKPLYPAVIEDGFDYTKPGATYVDWEQIGKNDYTSDIWDPSKINNEVDKMVFVKNKGDYDAYVRSVFAFEAGKYTTLDEFQKMVHLNLNTTDYSWEWVETPVAIPNETDGSTTTNYFVAIATYNKVLAPGALTEISLSQIALDPTATNEDVEAFGETYQVLVKTQAIQADGFDDPNTALNEGFGSKIPFENDNPIKGIDLRTALHNLNGDNTQVITSKVSNVIYALNEEYPEIVDGYEGTLVDVEQDVPVYAYYVPNGSNYDVYFLANDVIYSPMNSSKLYRDMTALRAVDTGNYDVSRTKNMSYLFMNCSALNSLDVSNWDVSNVKDFYCTFYSCKSINSLDVAQWDTGVATDMGYMFGNCVKLDGLNVSDWDVSDVNAMNYMFYNCSSLTNLDVSCWDTGSVTNMRFMFGYDTKLNDLDVANWDVSKVTNLSNAFYACNSIVDVDMANWDVSNVTTFEGMFAVAQNLKRVKMDNWQPSSAKTMLSMFYNCGNLESADVSGWNMPNLTTSSHMFRGCNKATTIDVSGWYTPSLTSMDAMFHTCYAITELDVSSFDTSKCEEISQVFEYCTSLETIKGLENWDTSSCRTFEECFSGCYALKELNLSGFNTRKVEDAFYPMQNGSTGNGFMNMFPNMYALEKLVLSADFSFDGDGKVTTENKKVILPSPAAKEGYTVKWRNVETGELYLATEIPEEVAATYEAYYIANP